MGEVEGIVLAHFARHRVLLRQYQAHDFAQFDVIEEELHVYWVRGELGRAIELVVDEVIFRDHFDIRIVNVDAARPSKRHGDGTITSEESPPNALPKSLVGLAQLRGLDAAVHA